MRALWRFSFGLLTLLFVTTTAYADPPSRVVRLKYMSGEVSVQPGGIEDWVPGTINRPLTTADRVWTDRESRAELNMGSSTMRLDAETSLTLTNISDDAVQVELYQGTLNLRVMRLFEGETYEVDTPNIAFTILSPGDYRFNVEASGESTAVTVWRGAGEGTREGTDLNLRAGQQALFFGQETVAHAVRSAPGFDAFDEWCRLRDPELDRSESAQYVSPDVIGYEDLDRNGQWNTTQEYGPVWVPVAVAPDWAPYRFGHWIWVEPWGWTWVDDAPWGFAPFHYGRWVHYRARWAWCPGPIVVRPYYAPALVAWIGGRHWGVNLSFGIGGGVGWFPLGYGEPYLPYYRASRTYFRNVNVSNTRITNITEITNNYHNRTDVTNIRYANQRVPGAVTAVPRQAFANSQPVARAAVPLPVNRIEADPASPGPAIPPSRNSVLGPRAGARAAAPPSAAGSRPVVSRLAPPPAAIPFAAKQQALEANEGRPLDSSVEQQIRMRTVQPAAGAASGAGRPAPSGASPVPRLAERPAEPGSPARVPRPPERSAGTEQPNPTMPSGRAAPRPPAGNEAVTNAPVTPARESPSPRIPGNASSPQPAPRPSEAQRDSAPVRQAEPPANWGRPQTQGREVPRPPRQPEVQREAPRQAVEVPRPSPRTEVQREAPPQVREVPRPAPQNSSPRAAPPQVRETPRPAPPANVQREAPMPARAPAAAPRPEARPAERAAPAPARPAEGAPKPAQSNPKVEKQGETGRPQR